MPRTPRRPARPGTERERIFEDEDGRLWTAFRPPTPPNVEAVVFVCVSNSRISPRAISPDEPLKLEEAPEEALRSLLEHAPKLGELS